MRPVELVLVALPLVLAVPEARAQAPSRPARFSVEVAAVYVDAFVTRGERPLVGLRAADFELRDNGVPQTLELLSAETRPLKVVMVFDTSSSMVGDRITALRAAGEALLDGLRSVDHAGLVSFSDDVLWLAQPTPDQAAVRRALARLRPEGHTALYDALYAALTLSEGELRPLVVLFSDGADNASWLDERDLRTAARRSSALVHVVGWRPRPILTARGVATLPGESAQERALREIAEAAGGRFWSADSPDRLRRAMSAIAEAMGHRYVLRYEPTGARSEGWHRIEARLRRVKGDVHTRAGYWVAPAAP